MKKPPAYENRYKRKLNMLEPGTAMLKWPGIFLLAGIALLFFRMDTPAYIAFGLAGALIAALVVLLVIEAHQDRVLNGIAARERRRNARS